MYVYQDILRINNFSFFLSLCPFSRLVFLVTMVAKIIRTLVFSPAKKMVLSQLFLSFAVVCSTVSTVLLDLVCLSLFCFFMSFKTEWMMVRSDLCV